MALGFCSGVLEYPCVRTGVLTACFQCIAPQWCWGRNCCWQRHVDLDLAVCNGCNGCLIVIVPGFGSFALVHRVWVASSMADVVVGQGLLLKQRGPVLPIVISVN